MRQKLTVLIVAALAWATLAPTADAVLPYMELKAGQKLILTNGKSVVAKGVGTSEVFGFIADDGVIRWFPRGAKLMRDAKGTVWIRVQGKSEQLGTLQRIAIRDGTSIKLPAVQHPKVDQPAATAGGKDSETVNRAGSPAPPALSLTPVTPKPGQKLVLTNGKTVVAKGQGDSEVFGIFGTGGDIHWFPLGSKLLRDAQGDVFLRQGGASRLLGQSQGGLPEPDRIGITYSKVQVTHNIANTSAVDDWPTEGSGEAGGHPKQSPPPKAVSGKEIRELERGWASASASMPSLEKAAATDPRSAKLAREMNAEVVASGRTIHTARSTLKNGAAGQLEALSKSLSLHAARLTQLRKELLDLASAGKGDQLAKVDLQSALQKQQRMLQLMSRISKLLHDTAMAVKRKIGG